MTYLLASAARATIGARSGQEDAYSVWPAEGTLRPVGDSGLLTVLADGMGGHRGGAIAGQTACAAFTEAFASADMPYDERLSMALHTSNEALAEGVERNAALKGMGCTLIGAWFDDTGVRWTSVGDSLLLLYRFPDVIRLNEDHSLGSYLDEQARRNEISYEEARANRHRNALRSALTGSKIDLIDLHGEPLSLMAGDWVILASDGIASLSGDEMADIMYRLREGSAEDMADGLIAAVEEKQVPEQDNTTVVAIRIEGASESRMRRPPPPEVQENEEVSLRTRRIGVVSGRKEGGRAAAAPPEKSEGSKLPRALLLAAGLAFVVAAAAYLFKMQTQTQAPAPLPPVIEKTKPSEQRTIERPAERQVPEVLPPKVERPPQPPPVAAPPPAEPVAAPPPPTPLPPPVEAPVAPPPPPIESAPLRAPPEAAPPTRSAPDLQKRKVSPAQTSPSETTISEPSSDPRVPQLPANDPPPPPAPGIAPPPAAAPGPQPKQGSLPPRFQPKAERQAPPPKKKPRAEPEKEEVPRILSP